MFYESYHDILNNELERRKELNNSYSLRAFARDLDISAPRLSQVLNKKQGLSLGAAQEISKKLNCSEQEKQWFCDSVGSLHARSNKERIAFEMKINQYKSEAKSFSEIQLEYFKIISDWYHFAILELTHMSDFNSDHNWIAAKLGITVDEVDQGIKRMMELELIHQEDGHYIDVFNYLETPNDIPSMSLKKFNTQLMKKAMQALYEQDVENREFSSNVLAISKEKLPLFKDKIRKFRNNIDKELGSTNVKDSVYCLSIQFFELTGN